MKKTVELRNLTLGNLRNLRDALDLWIATIPETDQALAQNTLQKVTGAIRELDLTIDDDLTGDDGQ